MNNTILPCDNIRRHRTFIEKSLQSRQINKVLHGFPSFMYWFGLDKQITENNPVQKRNVSELNVYLGIPFCIKTVPERCGYCLFPSLSFEGNNKLSLYLEALSKEVELVRRYTEGRKPASIFFGGGTPNLVKAQDYSRLVDLARKLFHCDFPSDIEITLEGLPPMFSFAKLDAIKSSGINRVSLGVQQFNEELLRFSGRKQKNSKVLNILSYCHEIGLKTSIDLIFGWPQQTIEQMLEGLDIVVKSGMKHLTHYLLNVAGRSDFGTRRRNELPSIETLLEMYRISKQFLETHGFEQLTCYDWRRVDGVMGSQEASDDGKFMYEGNWRSSSSEVSSLKKPLSMDILGIGFAGISTFLGTADSPGLMFMNHRQLNNYYKDVEGGRLPIECGFIYQRNELKLQWLFRRIEGMTVRRKEYESIFGSDMVEDFADALSSIAERGWIEVKVDCVRVIGDGGFYVPTIQNVLAMECYENLRKDYKQLPLRRCSFCA